MLDRIRGKIWFTRLLLLHRRSARAIEKWQSARLRDLVRHAAVHVPAYRDLFARSGIEADSIRGMKDLRRIPMTNKAFFLERPAEEYTDGSRRTHSVWKKTSGTSGRPLTLLVSDIFLDPYYADFVCFRFLLGTFVSPRPFQEARVAHINIRSARRRNQMFITIADFLSDPEKMIQKISAYKPTVLTSYTSILLELARKVSEHPELLPERVPYVCSFGEMLTPSVRRFLADTFRAEVYNRYGAGEVGAIALECDRHDGMHVNSESVVVEVVDEKGKALPPGQHGRIIVTDLLNYNMPFIRYDMGDRGVLTNEPCACGLETPRMWLEGRYSAYLTFGGRIIHHLEFDGALDGFMGVILQYQIVKLEEHILRVRVVPGPLFDASAVKRIEKNMREIVGDGVRVSVERVVRIPITPRGKSLIVSDESKPSREVENAGVTSTVAP